MKTPSFVSGDGSRPCLTVAAGHFGKMASAIALAWLLGSGHASAVRAQTAAPPENVGYAEVARKASSSLGAMAPQAAQAKKKMDEQAAENEKIQKAHADLLAQLQASDSALSAYNSDLAAYNSELAAYDADNNNYIARNNDYSARCSAPADDAAYNACVSEYNQLNAEHATIVNRYNNLEGLRQTLDREATSINQQRAPIEAELDRLYKMGLQGFTTWEANKKAFDALTAELEAIRSQLVNFCGSVQDIQNTDNDALEALKYCSSVGWDTAARSLPAVQVWIEQSSGGWSGIKVSPND